VHQQTSTIVPGRPHYYPLGDNAIEFLVAADFNTDGEIDLLSGAGSGSVYLLSGNGDGTFKPASVVGRRYYNEYGCTHAVGDFNNDGKLDYIFSAGVVPNPVGVEARLSNGDGTYTFGHGQLFQITPEGKYTSARRPVRSRHPRRDAERDSLGQLK
jgi:hypothetical protein